MIERPKRLEIIEIDIEFNLRSFETLEIDLIHINKNGRSGLSAEQVTSIIKGLIHKLVLSASGQKEFGEEICSYFVRTGTVRDKKYKAVFCICSDRPFSIGVITLHRV